MNRLALGLFAASCALFGAALLPSAPAHAESLRTKVQQEQGMNLPPRGMRMAEVKKKYGEPLAVLPTRGGSSKFQPPIHRWEYAQYIVYFENDHVVHSVMRSAAAAAAPASAASAGAPAPAKSAPPQ